MLRARGSSLGERRREDAPHAKRHDGGWGGSGRLREGRAGLPVEAEAETRTVLRTPTFPVAPFAEVGGRGHPTCPSTDERTGKMHHVPITSYYPAVRRNDVRCTLRRGRTSKTPAECGGFEGPRRTVPLTRDPSAGKSSGTEGVAGVQGPRGGGRRGEPPLNGTEVLLGTVKTARRGPW